MQDPDARSRTPIDRKSIAGSLKRATGSLIGGLVAGVVAAPAGLVLRIVAALVVFGVIWLVLAWIEARSSPGIRIVLTIDPGDRAWSDDAARAGVAQAKNEGGRVAERTVTLPDDDSTARAALLRSVPGLVSQASGRRRPVWLYPDAVLHDSFALGQMIKTDMFPMRLMQKSRDGKGVVSFHPSIWLGDHLGVPLSGEETRTAEQFLTWHQVDLARDGDRLALMVILSGQPNTIRPSMREAAATGKSDRYRIGPADRCRAALVVESPNGRVPPDQERFELTVRYVHERWTRWLAGEGRAGEHLLFLAGPTTIAMALGWLYGREGLRMIADGPPPGPTPPPPGRTQEEQRG